MMLGACASNPSGSDIRPPINDVDSELRKPCNDPGVDRNAEVAIARTRQALAQCERRRALLVEQADLIRANFGLGAKK
ncbi:hypothetical protein [EBPR siphovirus 2]|nr:hypothetical protein [EBPR siphovirus 2]